jgi:hypothetical protein
MSTKKDIAVSMEVIHTQLLAHLEFGGCDLLQSDLRPSDTAL